MKVKMIKSSHGHDTSSLGVTCPRGKLYEQGKEYDVGHSLAKAFLDVGAAKLVEKPAKAEKSPDKKSAPRKKPKKKSKKKKSR